MKHSNNSQSSTVLLKFIIVLIGAPIAGLCIFVLPGALFSDSTGYYWPIVAGLYLTALPFFYALYQGFTLLGYIDKNQAFTAQSVHALKHIKYAATAITAIYTLGMPYIYYAAQMDDAPGVVLIGCIIAFASFIIATASALFQRLFQNAVTIKNENDLTV